MHPKFKYALLSAMLGIVIFAVLAFTHVAIISSVGVSHPHAPPALLVGAIAALYSAPFGFIVGLVLALFTQKNYRRMALYLLVAFVVFAGLVTLALKPR